MQPIEQAPQGFTGTISLRLTDLIQMVCLARSDLAITVSSRSGKGTVNIRQGQIHHARTDRFVGESAFFEILGWNDGQFEVIPYHDTTDNSINKPWEHLLLEAMRRQDEISTGPEEIASPDAQLNGLDIGSLFDKIDCNLTPNDFEGQPKKTGPILFEPPHRTTRVLIVDDSAFFTKKLREMLENDPAIEVVGMARNGKEMLEILESGTAVDLITLDIEMPVMPGETSIKHIMIHHRLPVLIISSVQPHNADKVFDFLQLGAVDFVAKPGALEDHAAYASNLRELVKGASMARPSNFRRLRRQDGGSRPATQKIDSAGDGVTVIAGAEGAHIDWFRLPLQAMCRRGLVMGLQKLSDDFVPTFVRVIEKATGIRTEHLSSSHRISRGGLYLGNARREAAFRLSSDRSMLDVNIAGSETLEWKTGMQLWLTRLAEQARDSMKVCFLSAVDILSEATINQLLGCQVRLILPPPQSVVCSQLIDSIHSYAHLFPDQVIFSKPEALPECL